MTDLLITPRRLRATSVLHLLPEPRVAWAVPTEGPVSSVPSYHIIGILHGVVEVEYDSGAVASREETVIAYGAARDAAEDELFAPDFAWVALEALDQPLATSAIAFTREEAERRVKVNAAASPPPTAPVEQRPVKGPTTRTARRRLRDLATP